MDDVISRIVEACDPEEVRECDVRLVSCLYPDAKRFLLVVTDGFPPHIHGYAIVPLTPKRCVDAKLALKDSPIEVRGKLVYSRPAEERYRNAILQTIPSVCKPWGEFNP